MPTTWPAHLRREMGWPCGQQGLPGPRLPTSPTSFPAARRKKGRMKCLGIIRKPVSSKSTPHSFTHFTKVYWASPGCWEQIPGQDPAGPTWGRQGRSSSRDRWGPKVQPSPPEAPHCGNAQGRGHRRAGRTREVPAPSGGGASRAQAEGKGWRRREHRGSTWES